MKELHRRRGGPIEFVEVLVRQAHPGPGEPPYRSFDEKMEDARRYAREERLPWPLAVDDLEGTVHQAYGGLSDPTYLIDADGRVAFWQAWTSAPVLDRAIEHLLARGGRGVVQGGWDRRVHLAAAMTDGWRALRRGLPQSVTDLMIAAPGSPVAVWLGHKFRPLLAPLTLRSTPLPRSVRAALALGGAALLALAVRRRGGLARARSGR